LQAPVLLHVEDNITNDKNEQMPVEVFAYTNIPQRCGMFYAMTKWRTFFYEFKEKND